MFEDPKHADILGKTFVLYRATRGDLAGESIFTRFGISGTPTVLILDKNGREIDWIRGYSPPADKFMERIQKSLQGVDTYRSLADRQAKDPNNVELTFLLAGKLAEKSGIRGKAKELYQRVIALDPEGKALPSDPQKSLGERAPFAESSEFLLAQAAVLSAQADPAPMWDFVKKHPQSRRLRSGYFALSQYYGNFAGKEDATKFFEEFVAKYPDDPYALDSYVRRIIKDNGPLERGLELSEKIAKLPTDNPDPFYVEQRAELLWLKGDKAKAEEAFGKEYLDNQRSSFLYLLNSYAEFWSERETDLDQAVGAVDLAIKIEPDNTYFRQTAATVYAKMNKPEKALQVFGPDYLKANLDKPDVLYAYSWYWNREGKNLESALEAIQRMIKIQPGLTYSDIQAQILLKLKRYDEALKSAETALALARESAKRNPAFAVKTYEARVKEIQAAMAKEKK